jgi:hypothetical protein
VINFATVLIKIIFFKKNIFLRKPRVTCYLTYIIKLLLENISSRTNSLAKNRFLKKYLSEITIFSRLRTVPCKRKGGTADNTSRN